MQSSNKNNKRFVDSVIRPRSIKKRVSKQPKDSPGTASQPSPKKQESQTLHRFHPLRLKNHPFIVPVTVFLILFFVTLFVFVSTGGQTLKPSDSHVVIVSYDKKKQTIPTRASNVGDLLKNLNITVNPGDVVEPSQDTQIVEDNFHVNVYRARPVTIVDGGHKTLAYNAATSPRTVATAAGVTVYPEDDITAQPSDDVINDGLGEKIVINRAEPINLNLYGTPVVVRSHAKTVNDLLKEKNVKLAKDDTVTPAVNTPLTANTAVFVTRNGTQITTVEEDIPADTQTVEDASLSFGTTVTRQQGSPGKKLVTYQIDMQNGKETGRHVIQEVVQTPPVATIIARGKAVQIPEDKSGLMAAAGISSSDYAYVNYIVSHESGWCPTKLQGQIGYCPSYPPASIPLGLGYGLGQATPGSKMAAFGSDWTSNPVTQLRWATSYAVGRYGSWGAAYNHWQASHNW